MPDSPRDRETLAQKPLPQCKAFLICENAEIDDITGQFTLNHVVNELSYREFPARARPLVAFLQLYDGIGQYELTVELRNLADESNVAAATFGYLEFPERLAKVELVMPIDSMRLPVPGRYEIAILFDGRELATQFIDAEVADAGETG